MLTSCRHFWWLMYSFLSGCFWLFTPKFWEVMGTYKWYFVTLWMQIEWLGHSKNPTCCNWICLNFLHSQVVGMLEHCSCILVLLTSKSHLVKLSQHLILKGKVVCSSFRHHRHFCKNRVLLNQWLWKFFDFCKYKTGRMQLKWKECAVFCSW